MNQLEQQQAFDHIKYQLEELLYLVGDRSTPATEDEIMNYVIGMIEGLKIKHDKLSATVPSMDDCGLPPLNRRVRDINKPPYTNEQQPEQS